MPTANLPQSRLQNNKGCWAFLDRAERWVTVLQCGALVGGHFSISEESWEPFMHQFDAAKLALCIL